MVNSFYFYDVAERGVEEDFQGEAEQPNQGGNQERPQQREQMLEVHPAPLVVWGQAFTIFGLRARRIQTKIACVLTFLGCLMLGLGYVSGMYCTRQSSNLDGSFGVANTTSFSRSNATTSSSEVGNFTFVTNVDIMTNTTMHITANCTPPSDTNYNCGFFVTVAQRICKCLFAASLLIFIRLALT